MVKSTCCKKFFFDSQRLALCGVGGREVLLDLLGASIRRVDWPYPDGRVKNIALASQSPADYAGATLGPVAGRLPGAVLPVGGRVLPLCANEGANMLHGGEHNLSHRQWALTGGGGDARSAWAELTCSLPHGLDGFPGNRRFAVRYTLSEDALAVHYTAQTDRPTLVSMSNHTYWNLTGDFSTNCYDHILELRSDGVLYNDRAHLPSLLCPCLGNAFDFSSPVSLREAMGRATRRIPAPLHSDAGQLSNAKGYNNGFALTSGAPFAARLTEPAGGLRMTLTTDQPYLVVYSGGYLSVPGCALALEAQGMPGAVTPLLQPGQTYRRVIRFAFGR